MMSETATGKSPYEIRNYRPQDFDRLVSLNREAEKLEPYGRLVSPRALAEHLGKPNYSAEENLFIAERDGEGVAYLDLAAEPAVGRVVADSWVHPDHRRKGLAASLLKCGIIRAGELGLNLLHVNIMEADRVSESVLARLGFTCVRHFLELKLDMDRVAWQDIDFAALKCRHLQPGEERKLAAVQNRSFGGSWGYNPNPVEMIVYTLGLADRSTDDVVLAGDGGGITGYCWTMLTGEGQGRIHMIGIDPAYRGQGIGRRVLLCGLRYLRKKGARFTELTVDSENRAALKLYNSIGFEVLTRSLWYEKSLGQGTQTQ